MIFKFGKKAEEIRRLKYIVHCREERIRSLEQRVAFYEAEVEELEKTNQGSYDMNILFSAIVGYTDVCRRVAAPDPIIVRPELRRVFEKYKVNLPS